MTVTSDAWKIVSATDAAWVRAAVADVVTAGRAGGQEVAGASDGGHRARRSRGGSDDGKVAVRGVQDRQELRQL